MVAPGEADGRSDAMKVVLAIAWYFPDAVGGSEVYVRGLAKGLRDSGVEVTVAVPVTAGRRLQAETVDGVSVRRFLVPDSGDVSLRLDREAPASWLTLLRELEPDVVDLHSLTSHLGLPQLLSAREQGARTVTTLHLPGLVCARGTLMKFGDTPCDGDLAVQPCTACRLQAQGVPSIVGHALSFIPSGVGRGMKRAPVPRLLQRPFTTQLAHDDRRALIAALAGASDTFVALSSWQAEMLIRNGVAPHKVRVCRQGVVVADFTRRQRGPRNHGQLLRVGYVGRYDEVKGLHVLIDAMLQLAGAPIELHVWGVARTPDARAYREAIRQQAEGHPSIVLHGESDSPGIYSSMDVLAVPSIWFETGPLVVLEAHAAGIPIVGSDLGGIAERVEHGVNGLLVPPGDPRALAAAFRSLLDDVDALDRLRPLAAVRTMADVVAETREGYRQMLAMVPA
jgi:glycosyltransferase involved in cell wall biosynthesis